MVAAAVDPEEVDVMRMVRMLCVAALAMATVTVMPAADPVEAQTCTLDPTAGREERTIGSRRYEVYVPEGITGPDAMLVLSLHGFTVTDVSDGGRELRIFFEVDDSHLVPGSGQSTT
jgi:poly(3-hydroxybutyrate) depolymerase